MVPQLLFYSVGTAIRSVSRPAQVILNIEIRVNKCRSSNTRTPSGKYGALVARLQIAVYIWIHPEP